VSPSPGVEPGGADRTLALTRGVASGDPRAVAVLYETRFEMVLGVARRAGFDEQRALDVVQDSFLKAVRGMPTIGSAAALDAWLRRVAMRTALDHLRSEKRRAARERSAGDRGGVMRDERIEALAKELRAMKRSSVELLQLRYQAGLTLDAIARRVGASAGAVDGRLRRTTAALRAKMTEDEA